MEVYDELAKSHDGLLTTQALREGENGIFGVEIEYAHNDCTGVSLDAILKARPAMKTIGLDAEGRPVIAE